jgi:hypothetical protein
MKSGSDRDRVRNSLVTDESELINVLKYQVSSTITDHKEEGQ